MFPRDLLELTTSLPGAASIQSGEIVSFPQVLCWVTLYFIFVIPKNRIKMTKRAYIIGETSLWCLEAIMVIG